MLSSSCTEGDGKKKQTEPDSSLAKRDSDDIYEGFDLVHSTNVALYEQAAERERDCARGRSASHSHELPGATNYGRPSGLMYSSSGSVLNTRNYHSRPATLLHIWITSTVPWTSTHAGAVSSFLCSKMLSCTHVRALTEIRLRCARSNDP